MKFAWFIVSWFALAAGIMLVVGGFFRVQVREADEGYGDPITAAVDRYFDEPEAGPAFELGLQHAVIGSGVIVLSLPGVAFSLRRRSA